MDTFSAPTFHLFLISLIILLWLYLIYVLPLREEERVLEKTIQSLEKGDTISAFGIQGEVMEVLDASVIIASKTSHLEIHKNEITHILKAMNS